MNNAQNTAPASPVILDKIVAFMERFVAFANEDHPTVLAAWVLHTHCFDGAIATPYIYVTSAGPQSGKTTLKDVLGSIVYNPMPADSFSGAAMFKAIEAARPTIMFDEIDTVFHGAANEELRRVLNSGYKAGGKIYRMQPGQDEPTGYDTFGPKLMAGIDNGAMPATVADRSIKVVLKRADARVERFIPRRVQEDIDTLKDEIALWVQAHADKVAANLPKDIDEISARAFEISEPLLQVASQVRGWTPRLRAALTRLLQEEAAPLGLNAQALLKAREIMGEEGDRVLSAELAEAMNISTKRLGVLLAPYGIKPRTVRTGVGPKDTAKGYHRAEFVAAWEKYL